MRLIVMELGRFMRFARNRGKRSRFSFIIALWRAGLHDASEAVSYTEAREAVMSDGREEREEREKRREQEEREDREDRLERERRDEWAPERGGS